MGKNLNNKEPTSSLEKTIRALLLTEIRDWKQREQVELLNKAGFGLTKIAAVLGTSSKAISVRLAEIRRRTKP